MNWNSGSPGRGWGGGEGGGPPGAGGVAALTIAKRNFTRGSPGRGWGGECDAISRSRLERFPRARVGWRWRVVGPQRGATGAPGAGGVALCGRSAFTLPGGSPGRGWGGGNAAFRYFVSTATVLALAFDTDRCKSQVRIPPPSPVMSASASGASALASV